MVHEQGIGKSPGLNRSSKVSPNVAERTQLLEGGGEGYNFYHYQCSDISAVIFTNDNSAYSMEICISSRKVNGNMDLEWELQAFRNSTTHRTELCPSFHCLSCDNLK